MAVDLGACSSHAASVTSKVRNNMSQSPMCVADAQSIQGQGLLRSDSGANSENEAPEGRYAAITVRWALDRPNVDLALERVAPFNGIDAHRVRPIAGTNQ